MKLINFYSYYPELRTYRVSKDGLLGRPAGHKPQPRVFDFINNVVGNRRIRGAMREDLIRFEIRLQCFA